MSDPLALHFLQPNPDEVVVLSQTHKNKCTKLGCQSLLRGAERRGSHTFGSFTRVGQEGG